MKLLLDWRTLFTAILLWTFVSDAGLEAASTGSSPFSSSSSSVANVTAASGPASGAAATSSAADNGSTTCPPGFICYNWGAGPVGVDPRYAPDTVPSIIVTLLFVGGCVAGAVLISCIANAIYNRYTAVPKVALPPDDDGGEDGHDDPVVKQTLLTRLGVMSWKPDPIKPQDRFAKRAVLTWLRRVARIHQAPDEDHHPAPPEAGPAAAAVLETRLPTDEAQAAARPPATGQASVVPLDGNEA